MRPNLAVLRSARCGGTPNGAVRNMSWLSWDDDDDVETDDEDDEDMVPSDQLADLFEDTERWMEDADPEAYAAMNADEDFDTSPENDAWSEEELDDEYDPTEIEDYG